MTISIWRYSHLALAVSSFIFIALASVTGIVLAFEPVSQKIQPYRSDSFNSINLAQALPVFKKEFQEIIDISIDDNQFVIVKAIDADGENIAVYVDPVSGKTLGKVEKKSPFFEWVTNLHRSLFLQSWGRFFVGLTSFLLLLIAASGTVLIIQRQRGIKRFFTAIVKEDFAQYYHVVLGRLSLIPIIIIALTGTYLSLVKFEVWSEQKISHNIDFDAIQSEPVRPLSDFKVLQDIPLSEVRFIEFPFSDDPEDYYTLKLADSELTLNQYTGDVLSEAAYSKTTLLNNLSLDLHTGRSNAIWAIVLGIACINILFFIYSGFVMALKRNANRIRNKFKKEDCDYIILVGSENGSTFQFANAAHQQLLQKGQKAYLAQLNDFTVFPKMTQLVVMTSTYGLGDAPTNAAKFIQLLEKKPQNQQVHFSVVGFGSHAYPDFCQFAFEVHNALAEKPWASPLLEIHTVNDKSPDEFAQWMSRWSQKTNLELAIDRADFKVKTTKKQVFTVTEKTPLSHPDGAFLISLRPNKKTKFTSGDLLAIYPANDHRERLYSIGKVDGSVQLAVKLHEGGLGSQFLYQLKSDDTIHAHISKNKHFHIPKKASRVIMISNGTGIAPFLGMIAQNKNTAIHLYCGFRDAASFALYRESTNGYLAGKILSQLKIAFSREGERQYVKDLLVHDAGFVVETLQSGGIIMICGSLAMQKDVLALLEECCQQTHQKPISFYQGRNQILMDCY